MPSTADLIIDDKIKVLVFGEFKSGKTWGALTFPRPNVIDFDHGIRTLLNPEFVKKYGVKQIQYFQPTRNLDGQGVPKDYNAFDAACKYFDDWMTPTKHDQFDTWVIDSATTLIDAGTDKAIMLLGSSSFKGGGSNTYSEAKQTGLVIPKLQDYGAERSMTEQFVRMLLDSDKHVVLICHERTKTDASGATDAVGPLLTGKSQQDIPIMFDEVYRLVTMPVGIETKRTLKTLPYGHVKCGSRLGVPTDTEWAFENLSKIMAAIRADQKALLAGNQPAPPQATTPPAVKQGA